VSARALQLAARDLRLDRMPDLQRERLEIFQSALTYRDDRLAGLDAAVLMEVIEHVDAERLPALERAVFGFAAPAAVLITTPNAAYVLHNPEEIEATITRAKLFNDLRHETGPFDVIGDVHGCRAELEQLLAKLGYSIDRDGAGRPVSACHPARRAVFLGTMAEHIILDIADGLIT
jgi:hypothetical protein